MPTGGGEFPVFPCFSLFPESAIEQNQQIEPDVFFSAGRDRQGRFAKGHSGNRAGRPKGIANPKRRIPDLRTLKLSPEALAALVRRKPHLLRPLAAQLVDAAALDAAARRLAQMQRRAVQKAASLRGRLT